MANRFIAQGVQPLCLRRNNRDRLEGGLAQEQALSSDKPDRVFERGTKTGLNGVRVVGGADWTLIDLASFLNA